MTDIRFVQHRINPIYRTDCRNEENLKINPQTEIFKLNDKNIKESFHRAFLINEIK